MTAMPTKTRRPKAAGNDRPPELWRSTSLRRKAEIDSVVRPITDAMVASGYSAPETFGVRLALEEALVNAIRHGHRGDPSKRVRLSYRITGDRAVVAVEDEGPGFCPQDVPDPLASENLERDSGRGLFLIRQYMTWVRHNPAGNRVTMCKRRTAER